MENLIELMEQNIITIDADFDDKSWLQKVSTKSGWYFLKTNTPSIIFLTVGSPVSTYHYKIPERIKYTERLTQKGLAIKQRGVSRYVVYSGKSKHLRQRAREHFWGLKKTYCLGLENYPVLKNYKWQFCYAPIDTVDNNSAGDNALLLFGEQAWRAKNGWPILCKA